MVAKAQGESEDEAQGPFQEKGPLTLGAFHSVLSFLGSNFTASSLTIRVEKFLSD